MTCLPSCAPGASGWPQQPGPSTTWWSPTSPTRRAIWGVREDGAGLAARATDPPGQPGWEDAAVPPERLGSYLRGFEELLSEHGLDGAPYGHLGDGCLHIRVNFDLASQPGRRRYRDFVEQAADLAVAHDGSLSGEHGDGRARSELLGRMYSPRALELMARVKRAADPDDLLNPGVLVAPAALDADVRYAAPVSTGPVRLRLLDDRDLGAAVHRCTGVGKCLADTTAGGGVMCPSYLATAEEKDSTRGRARVLQDAVTGRLEGLASDEVDEALDLCLACKGCARDCPTGVDMATYKAEALHRRYDGRRRPRTHLTLGRLPQLLARTPARAVRAGLRAAPRALARAAGVDPRRRLPLPAARPASSSRRDEPAEPGTADVVVWVDTFTDRFSPQVLDAALRVLEAAGARPLVVADGRSCCGLTLFSTGQLDAAEASLRTHARAPRGEPPRPTSRSWCWSPRAWRCCVTTPPPCWRTPTTPAASAPWWSTWPPPGGSRPTSPAWRWWPSRTATRWRSWGGRPTRRCCVGPGRG